MKEKQAILLADFGGPRSLDEVEPFLEELLLDQDVVRTDLRPFMHRFLFRKIAKKRAKKVQNDYAAIGGKSPIYFNTEALKEELERRTGKVCVTFHRYLKATHQEFVETMERLYTQEGIERFVVIPLFPQFTYATTGSIARFMQNRLPGEVVRCLRWVKSYPSFEPFVAAWEKMVRKTLEKEGLKEEEVVLLCSFHGVPKKFKEAQDFYEEECAKTYSSLARRFPKADALMSYQSQFGKEPWAQPATSAIAESIKEHVGEKRAVLFVPTSFVSDHIETLFEIEKEYMPLVEKQGIKAVRVPAFGLEAAWVETLEKLLETEAQFATQMLVRPKGCLTKCPSCKKRCKR